MLFLFSFQYYKIEIFHKEKNLPFSGDLFYNPYQDFPLKTLKANFHAHSKAWFNLTDGIQDEQIIYDHYKKNGYDIISLSNYQKISDDRSSPDYIPVYEHGYNITKTHQLVINSPKVCFSDFSLFQNYHTRQQVINVLKESGGLVALAHPDLLLGYSKSDMKYLKGYDFIEVLNNFRISADLWDEALTDGYPAWLLADDDCHDISDPGFTFTKWTRIGSVSRNKTDILNALKRGCHYGVSSPHHSEVNFLDSCKVYGNELRVYFRQKADRITFISDDGNIVKEVENEAFARYMIQRDNSYVRVMARNGSELIYLNPIIRYNGYSLTSGYGFPAVNKTITVLTRSFLVLFSLLILVAILAINGKIVRPVQALRYSFRFITRG